MTDALAYDRRTIMQEAWDRTRSFMARNASGKLWAAFKMYLREAWVNEKSRLASAREARRIAGLSIAELRQEIDNALHGPSRGRSDSNLVVLRNALNAKLAEEANAEKRAIIQRAKACTVVFIKADGAPRTMHVNAGATRHHVKGDKGNRTGRIASHTRAFRHPNLLPVWDTDAQAIKSVNLSTAQRIETRTKTHTF